MSSYIEQGFVLTDYEGQVEFSLSSYEGRMFFDCAERVELTVEDVQRLITFLQQEVHKMEATNE
jgi:hypothetical protein